VGRAVVVADPSNTNESLPLDDDGSVLVSGEFDRIIGSDVLYERDDTGMLAAYRNDHGTPVAQVWVIDPHSGNHPTFSRHLTLDTCGFDGTDRRFDRLETGVNTGYRGASAVL